MQVYYRPRRITRFTFFKWAALIIVPIFLAVVALTTYVFIKVNKAPNKDAVAQNFEIPPGENVKSLAESLKEEGLISSPSIFRFYVRVKGSAEEIKAGDFNLSGAMSMSEILDVLTGTVASDETKVTFPEGLTASAMGERLEQVGVVSAKDFIIAANAPLRFNSFNFLKGLPARATLEGFLFPDTYEFKMESDPDKVIERMLSNFDKKLNEKIRSDIASQGRSILDVVILASIVEAEVGRPDGLSSSKVNEERRLVAGVFMNRLAINHPLQSDATLAYSTGEKKRQLSQADLQKDDPYNTYKFTGLPPGPINNPSLDSIVAATYPADTDYFYFLSKSNGEAVFARTLEEHNANKARYLQ